MVKMGYYYYYNDKHPEEASDLEILFELLSSVENEIVEFKAATNGFDFHKLGQYFSAISNEANLKNKRFGWLVFGVHDTTHAILGTNYKNNATALEKLKHDIAKETTGAISFMDILRRNLSRGLSAKNYSYCT